MQCEECRALLSAYLDGELMPEERDEVGQHLASCVSCAAEYESLAALSRRLRGGLDRPHAPETLKARIRADVARETSTVIPMSTTTPTVSSTRPTRLPWLGLAAAGLVIAALSAGTTAAIIHHRAATASVADQVVSSHIRSLLPGRLTDVASNDLHNVKPWFNGRIDFSPTVPRLDSLGFPLVGGRLDYAGGRPVAVVVYQHQQHVINVFSWPADGSSISPTLVRTEHGYHLMHWSDATGNFWTVSDLNLGQLNQFITLFAKAESEGEPK